MHRDQDFAENGSIENFDKLQSEHWQKSQYTLFMAINSFLLVDEWNKTEGSLDEGNEVTVDGELYIKDPGDVHYRPEVNLNSFWACVKSHVRDDIYCVVDEEGIEHEVERRRLRLRKRHTICVAHVSGMSSLSRTSISKVLTPSFVCRRHEARSLRHENILNQGTGGR